MCGIAGMFGPGYTPDAVEAMIAAQRHRGPDAQASYRDPSGLGGLGHARLSILDLSAAGNQPMCDTGGRYWIVLNGEIYNYLELRTRLQSSYSFRTRTDTEVLLAAYVHWGQACLDHLVGMFAFAIWDQLTGSLFAARDRFGVKPFTYHLRPDGTLLFASEIKALWAGGLNRQPDETTWATYLSDGLYDHSPRTFWQGASHLPAGHALEWQAGRLTLNQWYELADHVPHEPVEAGEIETQEKYLALLQESVRLRFRSDVPVGINLSGGLDSSTLLGLVQKVQGADSSVTAFTFITGDPHYDETPWVEQMLAQTQHPHVPVQLTAAEVPELAAKIQASQDEPYGGLPTIAYAKLFARARQEGIIVLLDGQGMDEQWAGYDYYAAAQNPVTPTPLIQGSRSRATRPECLRAEFAALAQKPTFRQPFSDRLRNLQYRDIVYTKIPRALRFNDRISMMSATEQREPFLDHRLVELALSLPAEMKIRGGTQKWMERRIAAALLPGGLVEAPKRPLQTPQREWLRGALHDWTADCLALAARRMPAWLDAAAVEQTWQAYQRGESDNSFYLWQWISLALLSEYT